MKEKNIFLFTKNKDNLERLLSFGEDMFSMLEKINVVPIIYGSLAYAAHTRDEEVLIGDIDILIHESKFQEAIEEIKEHKDLKIDLTTHHTIKVYKKELLIELDSMEYSLGDVSCDDEKLVINNRKFSILNIDSLIKIYKIAYDLSITHKKKEYLRKLDNLLKMRKIKI